MMGGAKLQFLGSGTSQGVPMVACDCDVCLSTDTKDKRLRCSVWIRTDDFSLLIDTTPDFRAQALRAGIKKVDAVLYTHAHADHILGLDDLRCYCERENKAMPIYSHPETLKQIQSIFGYAFYPKVRVTTYVQVDPVPVEQTFDLGGWTISPLKVEHGTIQTFGFLFERGGSKRLAYFSDCKKMSDEVVGRVQGADYLIIDGLRQKPHPTHLSHDEAVALAQRIGAKKTYLTHMTHHHSHSDREKMLGSVTGISIAYDGLEIEL
jgi:phosphoribosyl 1,2-cyclic phosphate phosphodiesterase